MSLNISTAAFAHPAYLTDDHFKKLKSTRIFPLPSPRAYTYLLEPLLLSLAGSYRPILFLFILLTPTFLPTAIDPTFPTESRRRAEDILDEVKATYYVQIFGGVEHGFATRGDPSVEVIRKSTFLPDRNRL